MFEEQAKNELFETVKAFHACKQEDGQLISPYLLKMKGYLDILERLGYPMHKELGMAAAQNIYNSTLRQILQSEKLTGPNFMNWHWNLRISLRSENKLVHLEQPLIPFPLPVSS
ncbi:hypothetical protein Tco_1379350 [Tanacetum coccineum]